MSLVHELEKSGNWLFRRRSWLPATVLVPAAVYLFIANRSVIYFNYTWEIVCILVSLAGELLRIYTVGYVQRTGSGRNVMDQMADELNTKGVYSVIRYPLYTGNFFMWLGPVLFLRSVWWVIVFVLAFWLYYERIMFAEEQYLRRKFGEIYDKWSEKIPSFIPSFKNYIPSNLVFSIRNVLKREYNSIVNIFLIFIIMDIFRNYFLSGHINVTSMWLYLTAGAVIFWAVVRTIHKSTKWLEVEGR